MPVIDKAQIPQQQLGALPGPKIGTRVTPSTVGRDIQSLGLKGMEIANEIAIQEDEVATKALDVEYSKALREYEAGYLSKYGQDAHLGHGDYQKGLEKLKNEYMGRAANERQKRMFGDVAERRYASASQTGMNHQRREFKSWSDEVSQARAEELGQEAIQNRFDYGHVRQSINTGIEELREMGKRNGWGEDVLKNKTGAYQAGVHAKVIEAHLNSNQTGAAQNHFKTFGKAIEEADPNVAAKIRKAIEAESIDADAQMIAEAGLQMRGADGEIDPEAGRAWIRKNYSGKRETRAIAEYNRRINEDVSNKRIRDQQLIESSESVIVQGGGWADLNQDQKAALGIAGEKSIRALEAQRAKGSAPVTDWGVYLPLYERLLSKEPEVLAEAVKEATYINLGTKLAPTDMARIIKIASDAKIAMSPQGGGKASSSYSSFQGIHAQIKDGLTKRAGLDEDSDDYAEVYKRIQMDVWQQEAAQQEKLSPPQVNELLARHFREYLYDKPWRPDFGRLRPDEIEVDGVPKEYIDDILDSLYRRLGDVEITPEMIQATYNKAKAEGKL